MQVFTSVDPLAEKYPNIGAYIYCHNNPVKYVDPDGKFPIGMHENMVRMALSKSIISSYATECIAMGTSYRADVRGSSNSRLHLDNMSGYKSISNLYNEAKQNFRAEMNKGVQIGGRNYYQAGESLHTIADFYSHSNYIELYKNYAIENNIKLDINTIPTFSEAMTNPQLKEYLENNGLKTGTYGEGMLAYPKDKMSEDKNSHGQMNLDSPETPSGKKIFSGKITMHEAAQTVAQKDLENTTNNR